MVDIIVPDKGERDGRSLKSEYRGLHLKVLLSEGQFQLVDTTSLFDMYRNYEDAWIWHTCDSYERHLLEKPLFESIGLLSNRELALQHCSYCQAKIPDGLIGQWKFLNWRSIDKIIDFEAEYLK